MFETDHTEEYRLSRLDPNHPLAAYSKHGFELDGGEWPSVEHYYQAMKYDDASYREQIRRAPHPADCTKLGKSKRHARRQGWEGLKVTYMTRAIYIKCRTHPEVAEALLATGEQSIVESSQYDYFWGCGRDGRGHNHYGKVLMSVRERLREERASATTA